MFIINRVLLAASIIMGAVGLFILTLDLDADLVGLQCVGLLFLLLAICLGSGTIIWEIWHPDGSFLK